MKEERLRELAGGIIYELTNSWASPGEMTMVLDIPQQVLNLIKRQSGSSVKNTEHPPQ